MSATLDIQAIEIAKGDMPFPNEEGNCWGNWTCPWYFQGAAYETGVCCLKMDWVLKDDPCYFVSDDPKK